MPHSATCCISNYVSCSPVDVIKVFKHSVFEGVPCQASPASSKVEGLEKWLKRSCSPHV